MLQALIHEKIRRWLINDKNPWEIEDLLTAVVIGSCEYAGLDGWLLALEPFLAGARDGRDRQAARKLGDLLPTASSLEEIEFTFWPSFGAFDLDTNNDPPSGSVASIDAGIPEVIVCLKTKDKRRRFILIEVKLNIGKSSGPSPSQSQISDQLAKYWKQLQKFAGENRGEALAVVYVTPWSFPQEEMKETRDELAKIGEMAAPIFWNSWRDFVPAVQRNSRQSHRALPKIIQDVCELMENRWGLVGADIQSWPTAVALSYPRTFLIEWRWESLRRIGPNRAERPLVLMFEPPLSTCRDRPEADWHFRIGDENENG